MTTTQFAFPHDLTSDRATFKFRDLPYSVWFHDDVDDVLKELDRVGGPSLRNQLTFALQDLAVRGRTGRVKGCAGENRGWKRTALGGGSNGMAYYLWWTPGGSGQVAVREKAIGGKAIWVRAVRDHNNHDPLTVGDIDSEYHALIPPDIDGTEQSIGGQSWTDNQQRFISDQSPIRVLHGHPGSGKTLALFRATETRGNQKVLYVSWSLALTELAEERLAAFTSEDVDVVTRDFAGLLGTICHTDAPRATYAQSLRSFTDALGRTRISPDELGPWAGREDALYGEFRAILLGRAIPGAAGCTYVDLGPPGRRMFRLTAARYREVRGGSAGVGSAGADAFLRVVDRILRRAAGELEGIFPELAAAAEAIHRLRKNDLPDGFAGFNRIVVDEVQDLTLTELAVIVELCSAIGRGSGDIAPYLLLAGDEGQTVRPVGFEWAPLSGLLSDLMRDSSQEPQEFFLDTPLRSPRQIAQVIENASGLYAEFHRAMRPAKQQHEAGGGQSIKARLFYVEVPDNCAAVTLLEQLVFLPGLAIVTLENEVPDWVPEPLQDMVLTPAIVKGLEYQAVVVLNPGELLKKLKEGISEHTDAPELEEHHRRAAIDRLRVAVSRASETLVFVDVAADDAARDLARELLGDPAVYDADDLIAFLSDTEAEAPLEDAIRRRIDEVGHLMDEAPRRAWQLAVQSVKELRSQDSLNSVSESLRREGRMVLLATAARLLVDGLPPRVIRGEVQGQAEGAIAGLAIAEISAAFHSLAEWTLDRSMSPLALLDAAAGLGQEDGWIRNAIRSVSQTLIDSLERSAKSPQEAGGFAGDVESWLRLVGYVGDVNETAMELRRGAVTTLLEAGDVVGAGRILPTIHPPSPGLTGLYLEAQGKWEAAVEVYDQAGLNEDALRVRLESAKFLESEGKFEEAAEMFKQAGLDEDARRVGELAKGRGSFALGNTDLDQRRFPREDLNYGLHHANPGQTSKPMDGFNRAIERNTDFTDAYTNRELMREGMGEFREIAAPNSGVYRRVIQDLSRAIELDPANAPAYTNRGIAHTNLDEYRPAIEDLSRAIELDPANAPAYTARGMAHTNLGEYRRAIEDLSRAIELDPANAHAYTTRGIAHTNSGEHRRAIEDLSRAIELDPANAHAYTNRGIAHTHLDEYRPAIEDLSRAIELDPANAPAYTTRGGAHSDLGEYRRAIQDLDRAIELDPNAISYNSRAIVHAIMGEKDLAMANYQKALMLTHTATTRATIELNMSELNESELNESELNESELNESELNESELNE